MGRGKTTNKREKQLLTMFSRDKSLGKHGKKSQFSRQLKAVGLMQILPGKLQWTMLDRISCLTCNMMALSMSQAGFWEQGSRGCWKIYFLNKHKIISQYCLDIYITSFSNIMVMKAVGVFIFVWWAYFVHSNTKLHIFRLFSPNRWASIFSRMRAQIFALSHPSVS